MNKKLTAFISISFLFCIALKSIDCIKNPDSIQKYLHFSSNIVICIVFLLYMVIRMVKKNHMSKAMSYTAAFALGPSILILSTVLTIINSHTNVNFIYSKTHINIDQLYLLGIFIEASGLISLPSKILKKHNQKIIFWSGIGFILLMYFYDLLPFSALKELVKEDHLIENIQAIVLILGSYFAARIGMRLFAKKKVTALLFFLLTLGLFFTAGDEISWGQRIFHLATPVSMQQSNNQNEITLHNERSLSKFVPVAYMAVGLYGSLAWIAARALKEKLPKSFLLFIPGVFLFPYFFCGFFYNFIAQFHLPKIGVWSEPAELMLYSGVMFFLVTTYYINVSTKNRK